MAGKLQVLTSYRQRGHLHSLKFGKLFILAWNLDFSQSLPILPPFFIASRCSALNSSTCASENPGFTNEFDK